MFNDLVFFGKTEKKHKNATVKLSTAVGGSEESLNQMKNLNQKTMKRVKMRRQLKRPAKMIAN